MSSLPREPAPEHYRYSILRYAAATRPAFLSVTVGACLLGFASAQRQLIPWQFDTAFLTLYFTLLLHAASNVLNDVCDTRADAGNHDRIYPFTGGSRFIQNGVLTRQQSLSLALVLFGAALPAGLYLGLTHDWPLWIIGVLGLFCGWAYSAPPFALVSRGLGEAVIFVVWLLVAAAADYGQRGAFSWWPFFIGAPCALLIVNILFINQFPDRLSDADAGKRTLVVRLGAARAKWLYLAVACLAHGWLLWLIATNRLPPQAAAGGLSIVFSLHAARALIRYAEATHQLVGAIKHSILAAILHAVLLAAALFWVGFGS